MTGAITHAFSQSIADATGTVTVFNTQGRTTTANATDLVGGSDWNAAHIQNLTLAGNTAGVSTVSGSNIVLAGGNNLTVSGIQGANVATISFDAATAAAASLTLSAGTSSAALGSVVFSNANNFSFGLNGSTITGSYTVPSTAGLISAVNVSAGTTSNNLTAVTFSNSNGVSFGLNGSVVTGSVAAPAAAPNTLSYWNNFPYIAPVTALTLSNSTSHVLPITPPGPLSMNYLRLAALLSVGASSTIGTSAGTDVTLERASTFNIAFYVQNTGASSLSLVTYTTATVASGFSSRVVAGGVGSNYSVTGTIRYASRGATTTSTFSYASTQTNIALHTSQLSLFSGNSVSDQFVDLPVGFSLPASNYWLMLGMTTAANGTGAGGTNLPNIGSHKFYAAPQSNLQPAFPGVTNASNLLAGLGSYTKGGGGSTSALGLTDITLAASSPILAVQFIGQA